jgi:hypothetical protein
MLRAVWRFVLLFFCLCFALLFCLCRCCRIFGSRLAVVCAGFWRRLGAGRFGGAVAHIIR